MTIIKIEIYRIAMPFNANRDESLIPIAEQDVYNAADPQLKKMEALLVKITSSNGLEGWGECFGHLINPVTFSALETSVSRFFLGKGIPKTETELRELMQQARYAFHPFGSGGPVMFALSGIDIALWDILAKINHLPLYQMLGGKRKELDVYASLVCYGDQIDKHVLRAFNEGFKAIKLHEVRDQDTQKARNALPKDYPLMVDVNCPWNEKQATEHAKALKQSKLTWLEEPIFPPNNVIALANLRSIGVPIAAGENIDGVQGFECHFINKALDIAQPSVAKIGGITAMLDIFLLAKKYSVKVVPHCFYYGAGLLATAHLVSVLDNVMLEAPFIQWVDTLYPQMEFKPTLILSDEAGLGFNPNQSVFNQNIIQYAKIEL